MFRNGLEVGPVAGKGRSRPEDVLVKIPALMLLSGMGYTYLPGAKTEKDPDTGILTGVLKESVEKINGVKLSDGLFSALTADLRELLGADDSGLGFYSALRDGWNGLKLLDFDKPEWNRFLTGTEISYGRDRSRFQPDITVFVNGLPLAMIEVKSPEQKGGVLAECERMRRRIRRKEFRRYLQAVQLWVFSNDGNREERGFLPGDGAFFTSGAGDGFSVFPGPEKGYGAGLRSARPDPDSERAILTDSGLPDPGSNPALRRRAGADTPTRRTLTGLLRPERFLFLIRYGIRFVPGENAPDNRAGRRILNWEQITALLRMDEKIRRGFRNWTVPCSRPGGRITAAAAAAVLLRERMPDCRVFWVSENGKESGRAEACFRKQGIPAGEMVFLSAADIRKRNGSASGSGQNVFFLSSPGNRYRTERTPAALLRKADPQAVLITMGEEETHEGENYTYLLRCADGTLYCGWTRDPEKRVRTHNAGKGAKYTRSRLPVKLVYLESFRTREEAMSREWRIKRMTRAQKEELIRRKGENGG